MAGYTIDLAGRIKNFKLPKQEPLIPVFEAIVNSLFAIEERQEIEEFKGRIIIEIVRDSQIVADLEGIDRSINDIIGFNITDNGIGLDDRNMGSFLQSDSTYRAEKGGKGVGRFSWLKAFEKAEIESTFKDIDGIYVKRCFEFSIDRKEVDDSLTEVKGAEDNSTTVRLINYKPEYQKYLKRVNNTVATKIMQHCMIYLMSAKCPQIDVLDDECYNINSMFELLVERDEKSQDIYVGKEKFTLMNVKIEDPSLKGSKLYLCANDRVVKEVDLDKEIVNLDKNLYEQKGFYYVGVLTGSYLDQNVEMNRISFDIAENKTDDDISIEAIIEGVKEKVEDYLCDYLLQVQNEKNNHIRKYIVENAPQFLHLLKYMPDSIRKIKPGLNDDKLDEELYKIKRKFDENLKQENRDIIKAMDVGASNLSEYQEKFKQQFEKISEANKAALAEYVAHRRIILDLLKKGMLMKEDGGFNKEAYIHNLIYPMRRTSEEVEYKSHNLWLVDERLAYCDYISSDIPFNNDNHEERTDILFLDQPVALSDEDNNGREYGSITIFELKRPMRNDYNVSDNPIQQMLGYVDKLTTSKVMDKDGRYIRVGENTQFYLYAICDITPNLKKVVDFLDFVETPDKMGLYKYHEKKRAYIEVLSYDKIISDAEKRNKVLFEKLGI
ncbi:ATP-binding protein [Faecalicatena contorta]|uniref:ATP-binding protein n=1 Tax=Faecalicatena contorta TaxID=39482 RepID=UPI0018998329|nr:ATP-binding protein [Faecalicatena contorta]